MKGSRFLLAAAFLAISSLISLAYAGFPSGSLYVGVPSYQGPGNVTANAFTSWWSCSRAYSLATAGSSACDIERASDSATCTVTTDASGNLDVLVATPCASHTVTAFCASTTCKVMKLYDQASGVLPLLANNFATAPPLTFGAIAGRPAMTCAPTGSTIISNTVSSPVGSPITVVAEAEQTANNGHFTFALESGSDSVGLVFDNVPNSVHMDAGGTIPSASVNLFDGIPHSLIGTIVSGSNTSSLLSDGTGFTGSSAGTLVQTEISLCAQGGGPTTSTLQGYVAEAGVVASALSTTPAANLSLNMDAYYALSDPMQAQSYTCLRGIWITPSGTSTGPGTTPSNGFDTFAHLQAHVTLGGGDCVHYLAGNSYTDSIQLTAAETGSGNTLAGYLVFDSVNSSALPIDSAINGAVSAGAAKITNSLDDGTPIFGTTSVTTPPNYILIRGLELAGQPAGTSFESCVNTNGVGTWSQPNTFGPSHWTMLNIYAHECNGGAWASTNGDFHRLQNNIFPNSSCCSSFSASAISIASPKHVRNVPLAGKDLAMPYKNIVSHNICYNAVEYAINRNAGIRTDGECIILDDFALFQSHGANPGDLNAGLYQYTTIVAGNVGFNNGGNGIQLNSVWYATVVNNTMYCNSVDQAQISTDRSEILIGDGDYNQTYNNVAYACGPWTYITTSLNSPSTTIQVNDIRGVAEFIHNNGNFTYTVVSVSGSEKIPVYINGNIYNAVSYSADVSNTCDAAVAPGCVSGTITFDSSVSVADGQQFVPANVQVVNNVGDCTGPISGRLCQFTGFVFPLQSVPFRGATITTCDGLTSGCNLITLDGTNPHSVIGANVVHDMGGGGGFYGLNAATPLSATNFGDQALVLGSNTVADPVLNTVNYVTADIAAGAGDPQGPGWLATTVGTTPPPLLSPLPSISPTIGNASIVPFNSGGGGGARPPFCPSTDITGALTDCRRVAFNIGAYNTQGARLNYTGIGDVANVPAALVYYGTTAYSAAGASGRLPALQINCNGDATTASVININTSAVLDDAAIDDGVGGGVCPGWKHNTASFTATIAAFAMNVSAVGSGAPSLGQIVTGAGVTALSKITACPGGTCGGTGVYTLSASSTVASGTAMTSANTVFVQRAFEQVLGNRECDLIQSTHANQPTLLFNNVSNKDVLSFSGTQWLGLEIIDSDQFCGIMFAQPSYLTVAEMTFGSSVAAVMDNNGLESAMGFDNATTALFASSSTTLLPATIDQSHYFSLIGVGNAPPGVSTRAGFFSVDDPSTGTTTGTFGGTIWQNKFTWGAARSGAAFTATVSGTTMTVTAVSTGIGVSVIKSGQTVTGASIAGGTTIVSQLTGTFGGTGTYQLSASATVASPEAVTSAFLGDAFTGFSPMLAVYGQPFNLQTLQVTPIALTQPQAQSLYTSSLKPNFSLP